MGFRHAGVEFIYRLAGEVVYRHADQIYHLWPGDSLLFDPGALHGPERLVKLPMTYLSIIVCPKPPSGNGRANTRALKIPRARLQPGL